MYLKKRGKKKEVFFFREKMCVTQELVYTHHSETGA